jgi:hypothetical protein
MSEESDDEAVDGDDTASKSVETTSKSTESKGGESDDVTKRRIRTLAIFFLGIGVYASVGAGLDAAQLFLDNLTTYFVSGGVIFAIGLLLLVLAR